MESKKALIVGHFSTFGDLECLHIVEERLKAYAIKWEIFAFEKDVRKFNENWIADFNKVIPDQYNYFILCCGPYSEEMLLRKGIKLSDFRHCQRISFNTSMINEINKWSPFQCLIERDSNQNVRVESAILYDKFKSNDYITTCFVDNQSEHNSNQYHSYIKSTVENHLNIKNVTYIEVDTQYPFFNNKGGLKNLNQFMALTSNSKLLITNRLHGTIFGLLSGVPVISIDGIEGGGKLSKQCKKLGWPVLLGEKLNDKNLSKAIKWCLDETTIQRAQDVVRQNREIAIKNVELLDKAIVEYSVNNKYYNEFGFEKIKKAPFLEPLFPFLSAIKQSLIIWVNFFKKILN